MGVANPMLMLALNVAGIALFFYLLYIVGEMSKNIKKILQKVEALEELNGKSTK